MIGVDETGFSKAKPQVSTRFVSAVVDITRPRVLDLFEGRHAPQHDRWLTDQPAAWKAGIEVTVCDLHEPFRRALGKHFGDAVTVADPFHVVGVATRALDKVRRRVQNETLGHRGRTADPLYRARKLLTKAAERLDEHGTAKLRGLLAAGDPDGHVHAAWRAKECLRDLYNLAADPDVAAEWLDGIIEDCATDTPPELRSMGCSSDSRRRGSDEHPVPLRLRTRTSPEPGGSVRKADCRGAGVRALFPHRDHEICGAERNCTCEMDGVGTAKMTGRCERPGRPLDVGG